MKKFLLRSFVVVLIVLFFLLLFFVYIVFKQEEPNHPKFYDKILSRNALTFLRIDSAEKAEHPERYSFSADWELNYKTPQKQLIYYGVVTLGVIFLIVILLRITKRLPKSFDIVGNLLYYFLFVISFLGWLCYQFSTNLLSDLLTATGVTITAFSVVLLLRFFDVYDLKKAYKLAEHTVLVDFLKELFSIKLLIVEYNDKQEVILSDYYIDIDSLQTLANQLNAKREKTLPLYVSRSIVDKITILKKISTHPYFPGIQQSHGLLSAKFQLSGRNENQNSIVLYDNSGNENLYTDLLKSLDEVYRCETPMARETDLDEWITCLLEVLHSIRNFYDLNIEQFLPFQLTVTVENEFPSTFNTF